MSVREKPERHMRRWMDEEDDALRQCISERKDVKDIATRMGRTTESIKARILQHVDEANIRDVAHILKSTEANVLYKIAINTGEAWCEEQDKWLVKRVQKDSIMNIAIRMQRTQSEIRDRLEHIGKLYVTKFGYPLICAATITRFIPASHL